MTRAIVLLAHGSADPRWGEPLRALQEALRDGSPELLVELAALKGGVALEDVLSRCAELGAREILVAPIFFSSGGHLLRDVPALVAGAAARHPALSVRCAPALGEQPEVIEALAAACRRLLEGSSGPT